MKKTFQLPAGIFLLISLSTLSACFSQVDMAISLRDNPCMWLEQSDYSVHESERFLFDYIYGPVQISLVGEADKLKRTFEIKNVTDEAMYLYSEHFKDKLEEVDKQGLDSVANPLTAEQKAGMQSAITCLKDDQYFIVLNQNDSNFSMSLNFLSPYLIKAGESLSLEIEFAQKGQYQLDIIYDDHPETGTFGSPLVAYAKVFEVKD